MLKTTTTLLLVFIAYGSKWMAYITHMGITGTMSETTSQIAPPSLTLCNPLMDWITSFLPRREEGSPVGSDIGGNSEKELPKTIMRSAEKRLILVRTVVALSVQWFHPAITVLKSHYRMRSFSSEIPEKIPFTVLWAGEF